MTRLKWDQVGERVYETGVDHGVLYLPDNNGNYVDGVVWNGLTTVTESPSGAEASPQYADNIKYLNLVSAEQFGATIEAFTYPDEFEQCDGTAEIAPGVTIGQQNRRLFGFAYRTLKGNDTQGTNFGYKVNLVYGCQAAPSEKSRTTVNESPEVVTFSWEISTSPVEVPGFKSTAFLSIDSTKVPAARLLELENILYGTEGTDPRMPLPEEVAEIVGATAITTVTPTKPTQVGNVVTIPNVAGVQYRVDGDIVPAGAFTIEEDVVVTAQATPGYKFPAVTDEDWLFETT